LTSANLATTITALDALTYNDAGSILNFADTLVRDNQQEIYSHKCGEGVIYESFDERHNVSFDWIDNNDWTKYSDFMDLYEETTVTSHTIGSNY